MPPKAKAKAKAKAAARPETPLQRDVRLAIAAGHVPILAKNKNTLHIVKAAGGKLILEQKGVATPAGTEYHRQRGTRFAPQTVQEIDWNQPPRWDLRGLNQFIVGRDGRKRIVTRWDARSSKPVKRAKTCLVGSTPTSSDINFLIVERYDNFDRDSLG